MKLLCCAFKPDGTERNFMILRDHLSPRDAMVTCFQLGLPEGAGEFWCAKVPNDQVERFAEHTERVFSQAKMGELFGEDWAEGWEAVLE